MHFSSRTEASSSPTKHRSAAAGHNTSGPPSPDGKVVFKGRGTPKKSTAASQPHSAMDKRRQSPAASSSTTSGNSAPASQSGSSTARSTTSNSQRRGRAYQQPQPEPFKWRTNTDYTYAPRSWFDRQVLPSNAPWSPDLSRPLKSVLDPQNYPQPEWDMSNADRVIVPGSDTESSDDQNTGPGTWAKTPGNLFGKRMLEKYGWKEGDGLGKKGEGRKDIVDLRVAGSVRESGERGGVGS